MNVIRLFPMLCTSLTMVACGGSSDDDERPPAEDAFPDSFPSFEVFFPQPLEVAFSENFDESATAEQIVSAAGVPATDADLQNVVFEDNPYTVLCEASYLPTTAVTAGEAYDMLISGETETIFAFEDTIDSMEFSSINSIEVDSRAGREFVYRFFQNSVELSGQGRAFYFNRNTENLTRSAILYFECFGFSEPFNNEINTVQTYLDAIIFGTDVINASLPSGPTGRSGQISGDGEISITSN